jgi:hypothetical protein
MAEETKENRGEVMVKIAAIVRNTAQGKYVSLTAKTGQVVLGNTIKCGCITARLINTFLVQHEPTTPQRHSVPLIYLP